MGECLLTIVSMGYATFPRYGEQSSRTDLVSGLIIRPCSGTIKISFRRLKDVYFFTTRCNKHKKIEKLD